MASDRTLNEAWSPSDYEESDTNIVPELECGYVVPLGFQVDINEVPPVSLGHNEEEVAAPHHKIRNRLNSDNKLQVLLFLLNRAEEGKLQYGSMELTSFQFNVATNTVSRLWNTTKHFTETMLRSSVKGKLHLCGRKRIQVQSSDITKLTMG